MLFVYWVELSSSNHSYTGLKLFPIWIVGNAEASFLVVSIYPLAVSNLASTEYGPPTTGFDTSGTIQIGQEKFSYTGVDATHFTGCTRAEDNTLAEAHAIGDVVYDAVVLVQSDISTGNVWLNSNFTFKTFDVINAIIYNAGDDMNGSGILGFYYNKNTSSPKLKMTYFAWVDIARKMKQDELNLGSQLTKTTITHVQGDEYDYPAGYGDYGAGDPLPHWNPGDASITSNSTFNTAFRAEATKRGENKAYNLTTQRGNPRWQGTVTLRFKRFTAGKLATVTSSITGLREKLLRIKTVQYNLTKDAGQTTLTLEEDEPKLESGA